PTTPAPIHHAHHLEQGRRVGLPAVRQEERQGLHTSHHLRNQRGGSVLSPRSKVYPEQKPTPHRSSRMAPRGAAAPPLRMRLIHLHARGVHLLHGLLMMGLCAVGRHTLEAVDGLEIDGTKVCCPLITDTPPLTLQPLYHGRFW